MKLCGCWIWMKTSLCIWCGIFKEVCLNVRKRNTISSHDKHTPLSPAQRHSPLTKPSVAVSEDSCPPPHLSACAQIASLLWPRRAAPGTVAPRRVWLTFPARTCDACPHHFDNRGRTGDGQLVRQQGSASQQLWRGGGGGRKTVVPQSWARPSDGRPQQCFFGRERQKLLLEMAR